eukprot:4971797-Ditylum_brightwellii.AAC.1
MPGTEISSHSAKPSRVKSIWEMPAKIIEDTTNTLTKELHIPLSHSTLAVNNFNKIIDSWIKKDPTYKMLELSKGVPDVLPK